MARAATRRDSYAAERLPAVAFLRHTSNTPAPELALAPTSDL
ncbi:hypothetical protein AEST_06510 [Alishewanella aestuarii B11]|uniref:Uncharacterized protein n=1 Tax=Alishewanella aestuarii B11 TaxID=1197174 RepID=J1YEI7_9ALTE|nr:hypothetical protein AEST_06510 [Alishewanella aestuarii B11]